MTVEHSQKPKRNSKYSRLCTYDFHMDSITLRENIQGIILSVLKTFFLVIISK